MYSESSNESLQYFLDISKRQNVKELKKILKEEYYIISVSDTKLNSEKRTIQLRLSLSTEYYDSDPALIYFERNGLKINQDFEIDCFVDKNVNYIFVKLKESGSLLKMHIEADKNIASTHIYHFDIHNTLGGHPSPKVPSERYCELLTRMKNKDKYCKAKRFYAYKAMGSKELYDVYAVLGKNLYLGLRKTQPASANLPYLVEESNYISYSEQEMNQIFPELIPSKFTSKGYFIPGTDLLNYIAEKHQAKSPVGAIGLLNIGNTCYMNSVLTCLLNASPFVDYFFQSNHETEGNSFGFISFTFHKILIMTLSYNDYESSAEYPKDLKNELADIKSYIENKCESFKGYNQHDALHFLKVILQCIGEELSRVTHKPSYAPFSMNSHKLLQDENDRWSEYMRKRENSVINDLFEGHLLLNYSCNTCRFRESCFQSYWDLLLSFENLRATQWYELKDLIQNYQNDQYVDNYSCKKCGENKQCRMSTEIWRLPKTLIISFKRFKQVNAKYQKANDGVKFPVRSLDLHTFIKQSQHESVKDAKYTLFGIINHKGDLTKGHYTAECRSRDNRKWYEFDDSRVSESDIRQTDEYRYGEPYILMYVKESCLERD